MAAYLDLKLTVPGGAVLPMAGVTWVAVSPDTSSARRASGDVRRTARPHGRAIRSPGCRPARQASTAGSDTGPRRSIHKLTIDRREARFFADVPDPGGVRIVDAAAHREQLDGHLRAVAAADTGRPVQPAAAVGRRPRRSGGLPGMAAALSSVSCIPTAMCCIGCTATRRRRNRGRRADCGHTAGAYRAVARSARYGPHRDGDRLDASATMCCPTC